MIANDLHVAALLEPVHLTSRAEAPARSTHLPAQSGVYAWYFDAPSPSAPTNGAYASESGHLLYVGIAPREPRRRDSRPSEQDLRKRIRNHFRGNASGSTLRLTLGSLLAGELGHCRSISTKSGTAGSTRRSPPLGTPSVRRREASGPAVATSSAGGLRRPAMSDTRTTIWSNSRAKSLGEDERCDYSAHVVHPAGYCGWIAQRGLHSVRRSGTRHRWTTRNPPQGSLHSQAERGGGSCCVLALEDVVESRVSRTGTRVGSWTRDRWM